MGVQPPRELGRLFARSSGTRKFCQVSTHGPSRGSQIRQSVGNAFRSQVPVFFRKMGVVAGVNLSASESNREAPKEQQMRHVRHLYVSAYAHFRKAGWISPRELVLRPTNIFAAQNAPNGGQLER